MTKTKIICTLGPATDQPGILDSLVQEGMSVARFNFSHGNYEEHEKRLNALKDAHEIPKADCSAVRHQGAGDSGKVF